MVGRLLPPLPVDLMEATGRYVVLIARQGGSRQWEGPTQEALEDGLGHMARACSLIANDSLILHQLLCGDPGPVLWRSTPMRRRVVPE